MLETQRETAQMTIPMDAAQVDWRSQVPSVSQLTRRLRGHIESAFIDVWVKGEISNFKKPASGHSYFILKDANAQLRSVVFKGVLSKLRFELKDGMEILLHGKVSVYEARGDYQIIGDAVEPVGAGALQMAFNQLKAKLEAEGLFDPAHKKPLPKLPKRIGVVTSSTGAAVRDILKVLSRRYPNREILILPTSVQGEKAAPEIVAAIQKAEAWNLTNPARAIEVMIVGRGGGSLEDLWPFNEEIVARAIYACTIPIISAVGHEIDFTIADFVADLRAPTPSAAAEMVVPMKEELEAKVDHLHSRACILIDKRLEQLRLHLTHLSARLVDPRAKIRQMKESLSLWQQKLIAVMRNNLRLTRKELERHAYLLNSLSPLQVISRGYSLTFLPNGTVLRSKQSVNSGDEIRTRLADGEITSKVD